MGEAAHGMTGATDEDDDVEEVEDGEEDGDGDAASGTIGWLTCC